MPPKYQSVADSLRLEISSGFYNDKQTLPTEESLCQRFQLSRQTIRRALSILEEEGIIIRRRGSGSRLSKSGASNAAFGRSIAVVTTYINDYIFPNILQGVEGVLTANGSVPLIFTTQNRISTERKILKTLLAMNELSGVLIEGCKTALPNPNLDLYRELMEQGVQIVFINGIYRELSDIPSVLADNYSGGRMLTEYLYNRGHRNIAGIFKSDDIQGLLRYSGHVETLRDLGLPFEDNQVYWYNTEAQLSFNSDEFVDSVLEGFIGCTAIVCYNDEIALKIVTRLKKRNIQIPEEIAVVSFDNSQYSELAPVRITSLSHGQRNLGELAAELMMKLLRGEESKSEIIPWHLEIKESS